MAIEENDAFQVFQSIDTLPEDVRPRAASMLSDYRKQQETARLPLWPSQEKAKQERRQRMQAAFDNPLELDKEDGSFIQAERVQPGLGDTLRKREASILWLADKYQVDENEVRERLDFYKADASEKWGSGLLDDSAFFAKAKGEVEKGKQIELIQQDAFTAAMRAAWSGKPMLTALNEWQSVDMGPQEKTKMEQTPVFMRAYREAAEKQRPYRGVIADVVKMARSMDDNPDGFQFSEMADRLLTVPPQDRALVLEAIANSAPKPEEGRAVLQRLAMSMDRGLDRLVDTGVTGFVGKAMSDLEQSAQTSPLITEEQRAQLTSETSRTQDYLDLRDDMREIASGQLSPLKDVRFMGANLSGVAENLPMTISSFAPYIGPALLVGSMQRDAANSLRRDYPGMSRADRESVAAWSAPFQAATEVISDRLLLGRLPNLRRVFSSPALSARGIAGQFAQRVGVGAATETAEEFLQGVTPMLVMEAQQALQKDVPDANWGRFFEDFGNNFGELSAVILPMALIGAGAGQISDFSNARDLAQDERALIAAKYSPEGAAKIAEAARAGDWQTAQDLMRADWKTVNAKAEPLSEVASRAFTKASTEIAGEVQQGKSEAAQALEQSATKGIFPRIRADVNGWAVEDLDTGSMVRVGSRGEAIELAYSGMSDKERQSAEAMAQMADEFLGDRSRPEAFEISKKEQRLEDEVKAGRVTQEQVREAAQLYGQLHGLTAEESKIELLEVLGNNIAEENEGVREYVSRIHGGGNLITVIHEGVHGRWNAGLKSGHYTQAQGLMWVRMAEQASGIQFLPVSDDAQVTPAMLDEAITEIVSADVIGRRKDDKKHFSPGLISRGISAFALSQRAEAKQAGKLAVFLKAWKGFWGKVLRNAKALQRARKEGKIGEDFDAFLDDLLGAEPQVRYEAQAAREATDMASDVDNAPFSLRGISESDAKNPMTIYRAGDADEVGVKAWASFTPERETAEAYTDNPGFGGETVRELRVDAGNVLDLTSGNAFKELASALGLDQEMAQEWRANGWNYPWEESRKIKRALEDSEYDAIQYEDDFPAGATTIVFTREPELIDSPSAPFSLRAVPTSEIQTISEDLERAKADAEKAGPGWAASVDLSEPVGVYRDKEGNLKLFDGHHRWLAADMRGEPLQVRESVFEPAPFSLGPRSLAAVADTVLASKMRSPQFREGFYTEARRRLAKLRTDGEWKVNKRGIASRRVGFDSRMAGVRDPANIEAERKFRFRSRQRELIDEGMLALTPETLAAYDAGVMALDDSPLVSAMLNDNGKLMSKTTAQKLGKLKTDGKGNAGDYDSAPRLPAAWYGKDSGIMPDVMAQALYEQGLLKDAYPDTLWEALRSAIDSTKAANAAFDKARAAVRKVETDAAAQARKESDQWAKDETAKIPTQKERQMMALRTLDAILSAFPPEVRGRVGGFVKLASLNTDKAREAEIERRLNKLDEVVESEARKYYAAKIEKLFKRFAPKRESGKKPVGKLDPDAQELVDAARAAMGYDDARTRAELAAIDSMLAEDGITYKREIQLERQRELVQLFGDLDNAESARMESAAIALEDTATEGWAKWKIQKLMERERRTAARESLIADTGKPSLGKERDKQNKWAKTTFGKAFSALLNVSSFSELLRFEFGEKSQIARQLEDQERAAAYAYEDAMQAFGDRVGDFFAELGGSRLAGEQLRFDLAQPTLTVGTGDNERSLSQLQGIQALLMWQQEDGRRHMEGEFDENAKPSGKWHYGEEWIKDLESKLSPQAYEVKAFLEQLYSEEYGPLNAIYRQRHGVNLPKNERYSPITVQPMQAKAGEMVDPVSGFAVTGSIMTPGGLRSRNKRAVAEPRFDDAVQIFLGHSRQMEHWKAYYDFAMEAQAILLNREVTNAVESKGSTQAVTVLKKWVDQFAQGGSRDAQAGLEISSVYSRLSGRAARVALLGRISTLLIQSTQLAAASVKMPVGSYIKRLGLLLSGNLDYTGAVQSPFMQRRYKTAPPIVQQALAGVGNAERPGVFSSTTPRILGNALSGADALFTGGTYAMILDYHRTVTGPAMGLQGAELETFARNEAERDTEAVAQPVRAGTRSIFENTLTSPLAKTGFAFASEARQKAALFAWSAYNAKSDPVQTAKVAFLTFIVGGLVSQVLKNLWREAKDDDDEKMWSAERLAKATLAGPLHGVPGVSELMGDPGLFSGFEWSMGGVKKIATKAMDDDLDEVTMRDIENALSAAGYFNDTAAGIAGLSHLGFDFAKILQALGDGEE